jgi:uncharacterized protein
MEKGMHPISDNGKICYIEIPAFDIEISSSFYNKVFGWKIRKRSDGQIAFDDSAGEVSGAWITGRCASTFAGLLTYIMVDDISATLDSIVAHGGKVIQPLGADAPELTARFSDPAGNIFGLYQEPAKE